MTQERSAEMVGPYVVHLRNHSATIEVPSSSGKSTYPVLVTSGFVSCPCPGYIFRQSCRHVTTVIALLTTSEV